MEQRKGRKEKRRKESRRRCSKSKGAPGAVCTHHGDSWPAQQPPDWHSADSCGSVPCAPPENCAACSSGRSSCTCEASPLRKEWERAPGQTRTGRPLLQPPQLTPPPQTTLVMERHLRKVTRAPSLSPSPVFPPHTPPPTRQVLCPIRFSHWRRISRRKRRRPWWQSK